jgi:hypothetical protein
MTRGHGPRLCWNGSNAAKKEHEDAKKAFNDKRKRRRFLKANSRQKRLSSLDVITADPMFRQKMTYNEYLRSPWWRYRRKKKIQSARKRCERCGATRGLQVHHLNYNRLWGERDSDLEVLCSGCHQHEHQVAIEMDAHMDAIA